MRRIAITLTTINEPKLLDGFVDLYRESGFSGVDFIVVGDLKTPSGVGDYISGLNGRSDAKFRYFDVPEQAKHFSHIKDLWNYIPVNSFARRNFGDLLAYREGYDVVIRIDDDNFPIDSTFFEGHAIAGTERDLPVISSDNGWFNICEPLVERDGVAFYPRGFSYSDRWTPSKTEIETKKVKVAVNAGLWLGDPDVDALTRLVHAVDATSFDEAKLGSNFALAPGTWSPINTQNTSFSRDTIPAAFISPHAGRYDDILSGYFLRRIADHLGESVTYGLPLLNQIRNEHNIWSDLDKERIGGETVATVCATLKSIPLTGTSYASCFGELISAARKAILVAPAFYQPILQGMEIWADIFAKEP
jgi:hypothetical protein